MGRGLKLKFIAERMSACSVEPILEQKATGIEAVTDNSKGKTVAAPQQTARRYICGLLLKQTFKCDLPYSRVGDRHGLNLRGGWIFHVLFVCFILSFNKCPYIFCGYISMAL